MSPYMTQLRPTLERNKMAAAGGQANHLSNGRINVSLLRECARRELLQSLNKQPGSKVMQAFRYNVIALLVQLIYRNSRKAFFNFFSDGSKFLSYLISFYPSYVAPINKCLLIIDKNAKC